MEFPEFTNAEKERINQLYGNDFEGITPEDAKLIARWESAKAVNAEEHRARIEAIETETAAKLKQSEKLHKQAMSNLKALQQAALDRAGAFEDGI